VGLGCQGYLICEVLLSGDVTWKRGHGGRATGLEVQCAGQVSVFLWLVLCDRCWTAGATWVAAASNLPVLRSDLGVHHTLVAWFCTSEVGVGQFFLRWWDKGDRLLTQLPMFAD
jgi:hypothetical protein